MGRGDTQSMKRDDHDRLKRESDSVPSRSRLVCDNLSDRVRLHSWLPSHDDLESDSKGRGLNYSAELTSPPLDGNVRLASLQK